MVFAVRFREFEGRISDSRPLKIVKLGGAEHTIIWCFGIELVRTCLFDQTMCCASFNVSLHLLVLKEFKRRNNAYWKQIILNHNEWFHVDGEKCDSKASEKVFYWSQFLAVDTSTHPLVIDNMMPPPGNLMRFHWLRAISPYHLYWLQYMEVYAYTGCTFVRQCRWQSYSRLLCLLAFSVYPSIIIFAIYYYIERIYCS